MPTLVSNSTSLSDSFTYVIGRRTIAIFFQDYESTCDLERSVVNLDGSLIDPKLNMLYLDLGINGNQDEFVISATDPYLEGFYSLKYVMWGGINFPDL